MSKALQNAIALGSSSIGKNRVINGAMEIDQRNGGAALVGSAATALYAVDRFICDYSGTPGMTLQRVSDAPPGFANSWKGTFTGTGAAPTAANYYEVQQRIEGYNIVDFAFGTTSASPITISFWVKCSVAGTFGFGIWNTVGARTYVTTYVINSANTWEYKTITIPGDTTGTWPTGTSRAMILNWDLGIGSNSSTSTLNTWKGDNLYAPSGTTKLCATTGATFQLTGVQLEIGSQATPFERRPFSIEVMLCQRYYEKSYNLETKPGAVNVTAGACTTRADSGGYWAEYIQYSVRKNNGGSVNLYSYNGVSGNAWGSDSVNHPISAQSLGERGFSVYVNSVVAADIQLMFHFTIESEL